MNIWIFNHYAVPMKYYPHGRPHWFAQYFVEKGHTVTVFAASTVHNSDKNLITDGSLYTTKRDGNVNYVYIRASSYTGNGRKRAWNMLEYMFGLFRVHKRFAKPDRILAMSAHPFACVAGIILAKKYKCACVADIADLWPESIVTYGMASANNPIIKVLRIMEKKIYIKSKAIVFTMEGAYDYIEKQGWQDVIPKSKVHFINNGVDLVQYDYNKNHYTLEDQELNAQGTYKVIYTGSLRKSNSQIFSLIDAIELMQGDEYSDYRFFIYGKGDIEAELKELCRAKNIRNVYFKGYVEKKYIPYILSKCDLNILNCKADEVLQYGGSQNKLFEYLASGHPVLSGENPKHSVVAIENCGISRQFNSPHDIVNAITDIRVYRYQENYIRSIAEKYDFSVLSQRLLDVIEGAR